MAPQLAGNGLHLQPCFHNTIGVQMSFRWNITTWELRNSLLFLQLVFSAKIEKLPTGCYKSSDTSSSLNSKHPFWTTLHARQNSKLRNKQKGVNKLKSRNERLGEFQKCLTYVTLMMETVTYGFLYIANMRWKNTRSSAIRDFHSARKTCVYKQDRNSALAQPRVNVSLPKRHVCGSFLDLGIRSDWQPAGVKRWGKLYLNRAVHMLKMTAYLACKGEGKRKLPAR